MVLSKEAKAVCRNVGSVYLEQGYTFNRVIELTSSNTKPVAMCIRQGYLLEQSKLAGE